MEVQIVRIEAAPGAVIEKAKSQYGAGHQYAFSAVYVLEDGRTLPTTLRNTLLRDAKVELAGLPNAPRNPTFARFNAEGEWTSVMTKFDLRGGVRS